MGSTPPKIKFCSIKIIFIMSKKESAPMAMISADDYKHLSDIEHVLERPEIYADSFELCPRKEFVFDLTEKR